jgi:protein-tyrosine phosphatase
MKIDIHCHLLPGLDDGPAKRSTSLAMARAAVADGREVVVATPHYWPDHWTPSPDRVRETLRELQAALDEAVVPLRLLAGHEVRLAPQVPDWIGEGKVLTLADAGRLVLLELPPQEWPIFTEHVCYRLRQLGITPVIAHPERNDLVVRDLRRLSALEEAGCLLQVNAGSLTGRAGRAVQRTAKRLCRQGRVRFVASDGHDLGRRPMELSLAYRMAQRLGGQGWESAGFEVIGGTARTGPPG